MLNKAAEESFAPFTELWRKDFPLNWAARGCDMAVVSMNPDSQRTQVVVVLEDVAHNVLPPVAWWDAGNFPVGTMPCE